MIIWLTGLPCSGKTTLARELQKVIGGYILDGDEFRKDISKDLSFSDEDREENLERAAYFVEEFDPTENVICAFVSPNRKVRDRIIKRLGAIEVYVKASRKTCIKRDVKGMWERAMNGHISNFTGWDAKYEEPEYPEVVCDTDIESVEQSLEKILRYLNIKGRAFYIGRWQPFHKGHKYIIDQSLEKGIPVLIGVRDMYPDRDNPYSAKEVKENIERIYKGKDVKVIIIPNIRSVNIGRKVGYDIIEVDVPKEIKEISATKIRKGGRKEWQI